MSLDYIMTKEQAADILTKALPPQNWGPALGMLGLALHAEGDVVLFRVKALVSCEQIIALYLRTAYQSKRAMYCRQFTPFDA